MKKIVKIIVVIAIIFFLVYFVYGVFWGGHSTDWKACKQYMWIFKESVRKNIDPNVDPPGYSICFSEVGKRDMYNIFHYYKNDKMYPVLVWEFKDLGTVDLNKIIIDQNQDLDNIKFQFGEILSADSGMPVTVKRGSSFRDGMSVNLDSFSKIQGTFEGPNYKGFYGTISKMSFSNGKGEPQIILDNTDKPYKASFSPTVFLLYKGHQSFYVIIINSLQPFKDASIINILNLK